MTNTNNLKAKLLEEKARLENSLSGVGHKNPDIKGDWEPSAPDLNNPTADINDVADSMEAFEENSAIEVELEALLLEVDSALARIEAGTYGICRICEKKIEDERLNANPSAPTCIAHREG